MFSKERQQTILKLLDEQETISVNELAPILNVSKATIRSDLNDLGQQALLVRTHGGAIKKETSEVFSVEKEYDIRKRKNQRKKKEIAKKALGYIKNGECIILDASSTCYELAKLLVDTELRLTILTNGLRTATLLKENLNLTVIVIGGVVKGSSNAMEGLLGSDILDKVNIDKAFVSAFAINLEEGLSDFNIYEVDLKKKIIRLSKDIIALIDSSKFEKSSIIKFTDTHNLSVLITDNQLNESIIKKYRQKISMITASV